MFRSQDQSITQYDGAQLADQVKDTARKLTTPDDFDPLLYIGDARYVLLGEASHGTSEYYTWRAGFSQRLVREKDFSFIAVEGDWPDCYQVNHYVKGYPDAGESARAVLHNFERWPTWMWANWEIVALVEVAKRAYLCFEPFDEDEQAYAWSTALVPQSCEDEVIDLLQEIHQRGPQFKADPEATFSAEQNALVTVNTERYYRTMVRGSADSWNVRDHHMVDTLDRLTAYHGGRAKAIIWAHNTHIGDARATDMAQAGMVNVGQLVRERHPAEGVVLVGFGSHHGRVIAGREWGAPMEQMTMPQTRINSWEDVLHQAGTDDKLLLLADVRGSGSFLEERGHRAIGVVYDPSRERYGNYVPTVLPRRSDAFLYLGETEALHPLHV